MPDAADRDHLREALGYEVEALRIVADQTEVVDGSVDPTVIELVNNRKGTVIGARMQVVIGDSIGSGQAKQVLAAISALTFLACFKVLDVTAEWALDLAQVKPESRRGYSFDQKAYEIRRSGLRLPLPLRGEKYLEDVASGLYLGLLPFRHEVVHRHAYGVEDGVLKIADSNSGGRILQMDSHKLGTLARFAIGITQTLTEGDALSMHMERLMKYYADQLAMIHGRALFDQKEPLRLTVRLTVPEEEGVFIADLARVRYEVQRIHSTRDVLFDLDLLAQREGTTVLRWQIPYDEVPSSATMPLTPTTLQQYQCTGEMRR